MTNQLIGLGWIMACVGLGISFLEAVYTNNWVSWLMVGYFLICSIASSVLKSAYGRYCECSRSSSRV